MLCLFYCILTGQLIANVTATDKDKGANALVSYKITSGIAGSSQSTQKLE